MNARARWSDYEGSTADLDRDESRSAARFDNRDLRRISGLRYEADRVPHESDVEDYE